MAKQNGILREQHQELHSRVMRSISQKRANRHFDNVIKKHMRRISRSERVRHRLLKFYEVKN